ncbi:MAG: nucleotidyl transferase AbiEii/AbiGii toxin family protein [Candidatus Omnitrophica bacterium]|nr:nucleotidyl transferase AbiEii/AbiGii toxin family protein [Candidatus Omnitrophota bacterium]
MIHKNKKEFIDLINMTVQRTGFRAHLLEKDYYLTHLLSKINDLSEDLIFKGGTCLNKIYYSYYRLSEDLDFSMKLSEDATARGKRQKCIQPIKDGIEAYANQIGMTLGDTQNAGRNESKQYVYYFMYKSVVQPKEQVIKFEIGLRFNPILDVEAREVKHKFLHPFTGKPLFDGGKVNCLSLKEIVSEKLRAAANRKTIAPRDFYDLDFIVRQGFNLSDKQVLNLFVKKLEEDGGDTDLAKYRINLGRSDKEIKDMKSRIENELFDVLTVSERENFDLDNAFKRINKVMREIRI